MRVNIFSESFTRSLKRFWYLYLCRRRLPELNIINMGGGLGNQIWIWAFGQAIAARSKFPTAYDLSSYRKPRAHNWELLKAFPGLEFRESTLDETTLLRRCTSKSPPDEHVFYENELYNPGPHYFTHQYWNWEYMRAVPKEAWGRLVFARNVPARAEEFLGCIDSERAAVAIHVRRGDIVGTKADILKPGYYYRAIDELKERLAPLVPTFFVFSDGSEYARGIFASRSERFMYADNGEDNAALDMTMMARCRHFITANSSFSFFAAYLSRTNLENKIVIAPLLPAAPNGNELSDTEFPRIRISPIG